MHPILIDLPGITFSSYRVCMTAAFLVAALLVIRETRRRQEEGIELSPILGIWVFFAGLIGARAFYILRYESGAALWRAFFIWQGGLAYYGALIAAFIVVFAWLLMYRIPMLKAFDAIAAYVPLAHAIARLGCFLNGCCCGVPSERPWTLCFPPSSEAYRDQLDAGLIDAMAECSLPVHATQLYEAAGLLFIFALLWLLRRRRPADGVVLCAYLSLYGVLRFITESFRGDNAPVAGPFTIYHVISLVLALAAGAAAFALKRRSTLNAESPPEVE